MVSRLWYLLPEEITICWVYPVHGYPDGHSRCQNRSNQCLEEIAKREAPPSRLVNLACRRKPERFCHAFRILLIWLNPTREEGNWIRACRANTFRSVSPWLRRFNTYCLMVIASQFFVDLPARHNENDGEQRGYSCHAPKNLHVFASVGGISGYPTGMILRNSV